MGGARAVRDHRDDRQAGARDRLGRRLPRARRRRAEPGRLGRPPPPYPARRAVASGGGGDLARP